METFAQCKQFMDQDYRKRFGEQVYPDEDNVIVHTPERPYRDRLCRLNQDNIFMESESEARMINLDLDDSFLPTNYHEFQFFNLNQSNCPDQVQST